MIRYYTNREIAHNLEISLTKWKRWSREFLPPDPLGGLQSGYARQYNLNNAFTVFLGGYLVSGLKYTIPEANSILLGLHQWLLDKGFYLDLDETAAPLQATDSLVREYRIYIHRETDNARLSYFFVYTVRGIIDDQAAGYNGHPVRVETYIETVIRPADGTTVHPLTDGKKLLEISTIHRYFLQRLG